MLYGWYGGQDRLLVFSASNFLYFVQFLSNEDSFGFLSILFALVFISCFAFYLLLVSPASVLAVCKHTYCKNIFSSYFYLVMFLKEKPTVVMFYTRLFILVGSRFDVTNSYPILILSVHNVFHIFSISSFCRLLLFCLYVNKLYSHHIVFFPYL